MKHVISRCAIATSSDEIFITVLDAVHWINDAWYSVTQSTITNTFKSAGFIYPNNQVPTKDVINSDDDCNNPILIDDMSTSLRVLDTLLGHIHIGGKSLSANEFVELDMEIPTFNEWNDIDNHSITVDEESENTNKTNHNDEGEDLPSETPPKLIEALEMVKRLHLLAATQQPQLHSLISRLDSQLTQLYIDSKGAKQTKIDDFFHTN